MNEWFGIRDHDIYENKAAAPRGSGSKLFIQSSCNLNLFADPGWTHIMKYNSRHWM